MRTRRKKKIWLVIVAPTIFDNAEIGYLPSSNPKTIIGRTIEIPLHKLTQNPLNQFMKCKLKIINVSDEHAYTIYYGHEYYKEYIKSLFVKDTSYIDAIKDLKVSSENIQYRILVGIYTMKRINTSKKKAIRKAAFHVMEYWDEKENEDFIRDAISGAMDSRIMEAARKIYPIRWAGIQKIKVVNYVVS